MPRGERQEVRVLTATFKPGDKTVFRIHRFPVTVYVLEGAFTLEMEGRAPVTVKAGQAMVEPPNVKMTGHNRRETDPIRLVIFYVSAPVPRSNPVGRIGDTTWPRLGGTRRVGSPPLPATGL